MKLRLDVGEPRNFDAGDKTNVLIATVSEGLEGSRTVGKNTEYWFVGNCNPVSFEDMSFKSLLLIPRYRLQKPPLELLKEGQEVVCNGVWRKDGEAWDGASLEAAQEGLLEVDGVIVVSVKTAKDEQQ